MNGQLLTLTHAIVAFSPNFRQTSRREKLTKQAQPKRFMKQKHCKRKIWRIKNILK
jgi:hypothetical protein